jgi:hypothetical protein
VVFLRSVALSIVGSHVLLMLVNCLCLMYCGFELDCMMSVTVTLGSVSLASLRQVQAVNLHFGMLDNVPAAMSCYMIYAVLLIWANARRRRWLAQRLAIILASCTSFAVVAGVAVYFRLQADAVALSDARVFLLQNLTPLFLVAVASTVLVFVPETPPPPRALASTLSSHAKRSCMTVTAKAGLVVVSVCEAVGALITLLSPSFAKELFESACAHRLDPLQALGFGVPLCTGAIFVGAAIGKLCLVVDESKDVVQVSDIVRLLLPNITMHTANMLSMFFVVGKSRGTAMHEPAMRVVLIATAFMLSASATLLLSMLLLIFGKRARAPRSTDIDARDPEPEPAVELTAIDAKRRSSSISTSASASVEQSITDEQSGVSETEHTADSSSASTSTSTSSFSFRPVPLSDANARLSFSLSETPSGEEE